VIVHVEYAINRDDRIVATGGNWDRFASENGGPAGVTVIGASLWSFVSDSPVRSLWQGLIQRSRTSLTPITLGARCDSPDVRRLMNVVMASRGELTTFDVAIVRSEPREPISVVASAHHHDGVLKLCAWCHAIEMGSVWRPLEHVFSANPDFMTGDLPPVSHGACTACLDKLMRVIEGRADDAECL
jgi:hypothetical protein